MSLSTIAGLAGSVVSNLVSTAGSSVVENLVSTGYSYLHSHMLADDSKAELKKLQTALPKITAVMAIAEALKMKHPSASSWVDQFRQAVEASEDVLDELEYKKLENMVKNRDEAEDSASSSKKRKLCTTNDSVERLKEAITMLNWATDGVEDLLQLANFNSLSESQQEVGKVLKGQTTSFLAENEVFGREVEKNEIIDWLKRPTNARLSSFGIVGVGGQGKTTLAQFAYQEMLEEKKFDKTIWVCVSTNFSVEDVTRKMLSETNCGKPLNVLQESLKDMVISKKILLVLDDVWDDKRRCDWEQLIAPLKSVQQGSKIILTTRMKSVAELLANVINTEHKSLALEGLGEQELRLLFYSYAFRGFNCDNHQKLQIVADQILKLLRRSPLAAKVIGSLLNSRMDHQYWRKFLNHGSLFNLEQADDVMDVLKLSYYHLPADLQVCFRFCSIFSQDHQFNKDDLIKMWITSGFIQQKSSQEKSLEDIGEDCFNLLLRKSFFEYSKSKKDERYVMHDLMHDLARNVSTVECCRIEPNDKSIIVHSTVRHVSVHGSEIDRVSNLGNLRSLVIITEKDSVFVLPSNLIKKPLRLLKINGYGSFELPEETNCLVHLRYLSIDTESVKYSFLASVYELYHLQVLEFPTNCDNSSYSGIETAGIANLLMLRYLRLPKEIMQTIHGVHKLTFLRELTFFVGQESGQHINELEKLNSIQHLSIENIDNIEDSNEAKSANLLEKTNLISLSLKWTSEDCLWKLVQGALPLGTILQRRNLRGEVKCIMCGIEEENEQHMAFHCAFARVCWFGGPLPLRTDLLQGSVKELLIGLANNSKQEDWGTIANTIWAIWRCRNDAAYQGKRPDFQTFLQYYVHVDNESTWMGSTKQMGNRVLNESGLHPVQDMDHVCHTDGAWKRQGTGGFGFIIEEKETLVMYGMGPVNSYCPLQSEAVALKEAVHNVINLGIPSCSFFTDCQQLVSLCNSLQPPIDMDWRAMPEVITLWNTFRRQGEFCLMHKPRSHNDVADGLARKGALSLSKAVGYTYPMFDQG